MKLDFDKDDEHNFIARLHIISGEADLYMKLCPKTGVCDLSKQDREDTASKNPLVIRNTDKNSIKTVTVPVVCSFILNPPNVPLYAHTSDSCIFGIFIVAKNTSGTGKVHYELSIEDTTDSHLMIKENFLRVK